MKLTGYTIFLYASMSACCLSSFSAIVADYAYQKTDWYKKEGQFIEQSEKNRAQRDKLLGSRHIGLYVTNETPYPAQVRVVKHKNRKYAGTHEKELPAGTTAELLGNALDNQYVYTITASATQTTQNSRGSSLAPMVGAVTMIGTASNRQGMPGVTMKRYIMTKKDWISSLPTTPKLELVLALTEEPGAEPHLSLRQK
jgi:hypothetical protein